MRDSIGESEEKMKERGGSVCVRERERRKRHRGRVCVRERERERVSYSGKA